MQQDISSKIGKYIWEPKGDELVIFMEPIQTNQSIELEGLEFVSQSDVLLPSATWN